MRGADTIELIRQPRLGVGWWGWRKGVYGEGEARKGEMGRRESHVRGNEKGEPRKGEWEGARVV